MVPSAFNTITTAIDQISGNTLLQSSTVMVIDDEPTILAVVGKYLKEAGISRIVTCTDPSMALEHIAQVQPDVILLDILMPEVDGITILRSIRGDRDTRTLPVIILTADTDHETSLEAFECGATDCLHKPVDSVELVPRVRNALRIKQQQDEIRHYTATLEEQVNAKTAELQQAQSELIYCLAKVGEYRDNETGRHAMRVGQFSGIIARELGIDQELADYIERTAPLHDIGKIGIPDAILLKPGKLSAEEYEYMQTHVRIGKNALDSSPKADLRHIRDHARLGSLILGGCRSKLIEVACSISLTHHEHWDGSGYPLALAGEDIPIEGRIVAVADVFDALSTKRPYKPAYPFDKCIAIMEDERGKHFDPWVLDAFLRRRDDILKVQMEYADIG